MLESSGIPVVTWRPVPNGDAGQVIHPSGFSIAGDLALTIISGYYLSSSMMNARITYWITTRLIAALWLVNGLVCKVADLVPRHQAIVARILGGRYARDITIMIGISEILMAAWILSGLWSRLNAITQIIIIILMNTLEFVLAPDLLLWGRANLLFAGVLALTIYYNEFRLHQKSDLLLQNVQ